jgi:quinol-cytochrome oxidoreductase complex cytochrome b subunit
MIPLILIALSGAHLVLLHENGSTNPLGICSKVDVVRFYPKFITKDIFGFILFVGFLVLFTVF